MLTRPTIKKFFYVLPILLAISCSRTDTSAKRKISEAVEKAAPAKSVSENTVLPKTPEKKPSEQEIQSIRAEAQKNMLNALKDAIPFSDFTGLITNATVETVEEQDFEPDEPEFDLDGKLWERHLVSVEVLETYWGEPVSNLTFEFVTEKGVGFDMPEIMEGKTVMSLCKQDGRYYFAGAGTVFDGESPLVLEHVRKTLNSKPAPTPKLCDWIWPKEKRYADQEKN